MSTLVQVTLRFRRMNPFFCGDLVRRRVMMKGRMSYIVLSMVVMGVTAVSLMGGTCPDQ